MADAVKTTGAIQAKSNAFEIVPLTEKNRYLNMLVYSAFGAGKTTLAASAADVDSMADVLMLDIESGSMTIEDNDRIKRKDRIDRIKITSFTQMARVHEFCKAHVRYRDNPAAEDKLIALEAKFTGRQPEDITKPRRYHTILLDSLSELDQITLYELLGFKTDMALDALLEDNDMKVADWGIFRKNNQMIQLIIRSYRDLPVNLIMTAHATYTQDELKRMFYGPGLTGKLSAQAQGFVDIVGYLKTGQVVEGKTEAPRRLYVQPVGKFDAKNRKSAFKEPYFDNPTMSTIMAQLDKAQK